MLCKDNEESHIETLDNPNGYISAWAVGLPKIGIKTRLKDYRHMHAGPNWDLYPKMGSIW